MPPPIDAELPEMMLLLRLRIPNPSDEIPKDGVSVSKMPPPTPLGAELPETVLLLRVSVPPLRMPPTPLGAELPEMVLLLRVSLSRL